MAVCPASKLLALAAGATALGGLVTGALVLAVVGTAAGTWLWIGRGRACRRPVDSERDHHAIEPRGTVE